MKLEGLVHATMTLLLRDGVQGTEVALAYKTDKIGVDQLNGFGGGVEDGESIDEATLRELTEEAAVEVDPADLERRALIYCNNYNKRGERFVCKLYVTVARRFRGEPRLQPDSKMRNLSWYPVASLPIDEMMFGDRVWIERVLAGERLMGEIYYAPGMNSFEKPPRIDTTTAFRLNRSWHP
jgi:8-oxo-dGTP diphosphatase/2-hydroxy-dATP diphosphatase